MQRATVDLPEPDSPTMPSVSPRRISSVTSRGRGHARASRAEPAAPRVGLGQRRRPHDDRRRSTTSRVRRREARHRRDQHPRVLVLRMRRAPRASGPISTSSPWRSTATRSAISATTPKSCVMNSTPVPCSRVQFADQREDLRLRRDVERGGRLVGDQQRGFEHQRHRDHDRAGAGRRRADADTTRSSARDRAAATSRTIVAARAVARRGGAAARCASRAPRRSGRRSACTGIERGHRLLEDHRHARAAQRAQARLARARARSRRRAGSAPPVARELRRQQAHHRLRDDRSCRSPIRRPGRRSRPASTVKLDAVDRVRAIGAARAARRSDRARRARDRASLRSLTGASAMRGSSVSRRPSPSMLTASTVSARKMPG